MFWAIGWIFWVPLILMFMMMRKRHWQRREQVRLMSEYRPRFEEAERQQSYIDALEARVTELEARLDFTERLVSTRSASA